MQNDCKKIQVVLQLNVRRQNVLTPPSLPAG